MFRRALALLPLVLLLLTSGCNDPLGVTTRTRIAAEADVRVAQEESAARQAEANAAARIAQAEARADERIVRAEAWRDVKLGAQRLRAWRTFWSTVSATVLLCLLVWRLTTPDGLRWLTLLILAQSRGYRLSRKGPGDYVLHADWGSRSVHAVHDLWGKM